MDTSNESHGFVSDTRSTDNYGKGWELIFGPYFWTLLIITLIYMVIRGPLSSMQFTYEYGSNPSSGIGFFGILYGIFLAGPIGMSFNWVFLKAARQEEFQIKDLFAVFDRNYWNAVGASLLVGLAVVVGFIFLVVPGIIVACRLAFVPFLIIDQKMEFREALRASWSMTKGYGWTIFGMALLGILIVIAGLIALGVGVIVSVMWITAAYAVLYHSVAMKDGIPMDETQEEILDEEAEEPFME